MDFIEELAGYVIKYAHQYGICVHSPIIAQGILESASGTSNKVKIEVDGKTEWRHNYFGLKWRNNRCEISNDYFEEWTAEQNKDGSYKNIVSKFCKFKSLEECVIGYFQWTNIPNYKNLKGVTDPETYLKNIKADGYATSKEYVQKVMNVIKKYNLTKYDKKQDVVNYVVKRGDTLSVIGKMFSVDYHVIADYNGIKNVNVIRVGQELKIPVNSANTAKKDSCEKTPLNIKTNLAHKSNYGNQRDLSLIEVFLVFHYTGNDGDTDEANGKYFNGPNRNASAHYFVDDDSITNTVPENFVAYHCGTKKKYYHPKCRNSNSIGIEMCDTQKNGVYNLSPKTRANAIALGKMLMKKYNIPISRVVRHYDVTHKICPAYFVNDENAWEQFLNDLES